MIKTMRKRIVAVVALIALVAFFVNVTAVYAQVSTVDKPAFTTSSGTGGNKNQAKDDYIKDPANVADIYKSSDDSDDDAKDDVEYDENCEPTYGGGQTCIYNKSFEIDKDVRIEGDDDWEDKVTDVEADDIVEFRIRVKNVGDIEVDNMKMEDFLPDEMEKVSGDLTEYWDDFEPGETKEFKIKAQIDEDEFDRENFEKCVVNKVEVSYDGDFEGSDTATVCYGDAEVTELPETGAGATLALALTGLSSITAGAFIRRKA